MSPKPQFTPKPAFLGASYKWCPDHGMGGYGKAWACPYCVAIGGSSKPAPAPPDHPGLAKVSKYRAIPTHVDGIRFASKTEAGLYEWASAKGHVIVPHVRFPLHVLTSPGIPASWFTPDLLVMVDNGGTPPLYVVEAWEAKGAKACESRDYQLRARAFVRSYPSIRLRVFRKVGGEFVEDNQSARAEGG